MSNITLFLVVYLVYIILIEIVCIKVIDRSVTLIEFMITAIMYWATYLFLTFF